MFKPFKSTARFFKQYKQFGLVVFSIFLATILGVFNQRTASHWVLIISALINLVPLLWGMIQDLRSGTYGVDILAATAIGTSVLLHEYWAGIIIVLMLTGGEALEDYAEKRAKKELSALLERAPTKAHIIRGRKTVDVKVSVVATGDKLLIKAGEVVPVDCAILDGTAAFDESSLTGESLPSVKKVGDNLMSGSINIDGPVTVRALHSAKDSQFEQIIKLVKSAEASKAPFVRLTDRYSIPFTIVSFVIAGAAWAISGDSLRFLEVIVVATPCPLLLGAPIALISGMSRAAKHGIIVKTGSALERLAEVKTLAFDKTGTLTVGKPTVDELKVFSPFTKSEVLGIAAGLEQSSNHVLARAVVAKAVEDKVKIIKAKKVKELAGNGLSAHLQGKDILIGRVGLMDDSGIEFPKTFKSATVQQTAAYVAIGGKLAGVITFRDEIREETKSTLDRLRTIGIKHFLLITGDNKPAADLVAKKLGIDDVRAEALPVDKIVAIEDAPYHPIGFVGDGVNDAPVLAASDVGIAIGARGSTAASESADVVIMVDDFYQVATSVEIAKRTFFIAKQSILIGIGMSVVLMFIFSTGKFRPVYGAAIQELVDVTVIFNALRAHGSWKRKTSLMPKPEPTA